MAYARLKRAERPVLEQGATTCCCAHSEKSGIEDPQVIQWEIFLTTGESAVYGSAPVIAEPVSASPSSGC